MTGQREMNGGVRSSNTYWRLRQHNDRLYPTVSLDIRLLL